MTSTTQTSRPGAANNFKQFCTDKIAQGYEAFHNIPSLEQTELLFAYLNNQPKDHVADILSESLADAPYQWIKLLEGCSDKLHQVATPQQYQLAQWLIASLKDLCEKQMVDQFEDIYAFWHFEHGGTIEQPY